MAATIHLGAVDIAADDYASQGNAILGIRDSGKTWAAILMAEKLMAAGFPIVAFDPIGRWRFLGTAGTGKGFPIVVAGGASADLPLTPHSAPEIMRAAMRERVSLVFDLYSMDLSKADWKRIVTESVKAMLYENKDYGLRHVFIEEAAEFVPQLMPKDGVTSHAYDQIERLARMGGNALLGYTLINQRAEQVNKAVLELCDTLFLFRQKGKNSLNSLSKWLDIGAAKKGDSIISSLPTLLQGTCWLWPAGTDAPVKVKMPPIQTFAPDRRAKHSPGGTVDAPRVDVGKFVAGMKGALEKVIAEAEANDPKVLKARIRELERQAGAGPAASDRRAIEDAGREGHRDGLKQGRMEAAREIMAVVSTVSRLAYEISAQSDKFDEWAAAQMDAASQPTMPRIPASYDAPKRDIRPIIRPDRRATGPGISLPKGELATLIAIAQYPDGASREQLSVLTGYKRSSRDAYIQRLKERGLVDARMDGIQATADGIVALGSDYEPLPTGRKLQDYWLGRLPEGERAVLQLLIHAYPKPVDRERVDRETGYKRSSRDAYIQRLKTRKLVVIEGRGEIRASDHLFG